MITKKLGTQAWKESKDYQKKALSSGINSTAFTGIHIQESARMGSATKHIHDDQEKGEN